MQEEGDYYTVKGNLYAQAKILSSEFEVLSVGDHFAMGKYNYIKGNEEVGEEYEE